MKPLTLTALAALSVALLGACDRAAETPPRPNLQTSFDKADLNKDGVIERNEATSIANHDFGDVDTDDNQAVSIDEFRVALEDPAPRG
jgi:hypothetical protein